MPCIWLLLSSWSSISAQTFDSKARITLGLAGQVQDQRLYDWPGGASRGLIEQEKLMPTWHGSVTVMKPILFRHDFSIDLGLGYGFEINSFSRPFNMVPFLPPGTLIVDTKGRYIRAYHVHMAQIGFSGSHILMKSKKSGDIVFVCDAWGGFHFVKGMIESTASSSFRKYHHSVFHLAPYSLEINPGLGYDKGKYRVTLSYRAWQIKQVDPVLFSPRLYHNLPEGEYERYNPFKLWVTVSRDL